MRDLLRFGVPNLLWLGSALPAAFRFRRALADPERAQIALLRNVLRRNRGSEYGRRYGFERIRSAREFQEAVPVVTYEVLREPIEAIRRGRQGVLTEAPVLMLEKTAGSGGAAKYIPFTAALKREFGAAVSAWVADLYWRRPRMLGGGAYWSVSPLAAEREVTEGGLPVGFEEDTEYFGRVERALLARLILTPPELPRVQEIEASRYVTLRFLLETPRLSFVSVWSPSFLTLLLDFLQSHAEALIADVERGTLTPPATLPPGLQAALERRLCPRPARARRLRELLRARGSLPPAEVWPRLRVVSCWASAAAAKQVPEMRARLGGSDRGNAGWKACATPEIQPKGLLATEGVVSVPLTGLPGAALAVTSHFLEFREVEAAEGRPRLAHELEEGRPYSVLITTGGGLYRYALGDVVQVVGRAARTPLVEFTGREGHVSDVCGEKLHEGWIRELLEALRRERGAAPRFAMLAPEEGEPPHYDLFLEIDGWSDAAVRALSEPVEGWLRQGYHYGYCRRLGQLGPARVVPVRRGWEAYLERCAALGQRRGSVKPVALRRETGWQAWFEERSPAGSRA